VLRQKAGSSRRETTSLPNSFAVLDHLFVIQFRPNGKGFFTNALKNALLPQAPRDRPIAAPPGGGQCQIPVSFYK
jgi:hypothetical protein